MAGRNAAKSVKPEDVPLEAGLTPPVQKQGANAGLTYQQLMDEFVQKKMATRLANIVSLSDSEFKEFQNDIADLKQKLPSLNRPQSNDAKKANATSSEVNNRDGLEGFLIKSENITRSPFMAAARSVVGLIGKFVDSKSSWFQSLKNTVSNLFTQSAKDQVYNRVNQGESKMDDTQNAKTTRVQTKMKGTYADTRINMTSSRATEQKVATSQEVNEIKAEAETTAKSGVTAHAKAQVASKIEPSVPKVSQDDTMRSSPRPR